ncbi:MAG: hypothetical protein R3E87_03475 [Burkholderiaceae bacterium]
MDDVPARGDRVSRAIADSGTVTVPAGSLDTEPGKAADARDFLGSRAQWVVRGGCDTHRSTTP